MKHTTIIGVTIKFSSTNGKNIIQPDCGNSPRKAFLKDLYISLANGDIDILNNSIQNNVNWQVAGQKNVTGKDNL